MRERATTFVPVSPFFGLPRVQTGGGGVTVSLRDGVAMASVLMKKGRRAALEERVRAHYCVHLPQTPRRANAGEIAFIATGPESWFATFEQGDPGFAASLRRSLGDLASVSDQSDGYAVLRLVGPRVRETLAKLVPIDVHARAFPVASAAVTVAGHIGIALWRLEGDAEDAVTFEVALYRSMARSFWHMLNESAAEFGVEVRTAESLVRDPASFGSTAAIHSQPGLF
jgi:methylglutamate dehydrogenase subunit D